MSYFACRPLRQVEGRHPRLEDIFGHSRNRLLNRDLERDLFEHVRDIESGGDFDQGEPLGLEPEDGALCHVQDFLIISTGLLGIERHVLDAIDKLFVASLERKTETDESR